MAGSELSLGRRSAQSKKARPVRVLSFAASALFRGGIERLLETEPAVEIVGSTTSLAELSTLTAQRECDVVLVASGSVAEISAVLKMSQPGHLPVVLLANKASMPLQPDAVPEGIAGVLTDPSGAELSAALRAAATGLAVFSSEIGKQMVTSLQAAHQGSRSESETLETLPEELTAREHEVLEMMVEGLSNKEIAVQLNISVHTVKFHISSILGKLGAATRTEATTIGIRRGLITI